MRGIRVGVLMGGKSVEREVSLNSGRTVCDHLDSSRYDVVPLFQKITGELYELPWRFLHRGKTSDFEHRLEGEAKKLAWDDLKHHVDCVFIAQHGRYAEDGALQGMLEVLQIPYVGSKVLASALGMHKGMQKEFLSAAGISVPRGYIIQAHEITKFEDTRIQFPCFVKPIQEGSSLGVSKVFTQEELHFAVQKAALIDKNVTQDVIVEECIEGMEFSCILITDHATQEIIALPPTEIELEKDALLFDYEQKYMPGRATKHTPARCSEEHRSHIQNICKKVFTVLGFKNFARIDGFLTDAGDVVITDPNTFSGLAPSSYAFLQAAEIGMSHAGFINHIIETELRAYGMFNHASLVNQSERCIQI